MIDRRTALALLVAGTFFMENLDATAVDPNVGVSAYMLTLGVFILISGSIK